MVCLFLLSSKRLFDEFASWLVKRQSMFIVYTVLLRVCHTRQQLNALNVFEATEKRDEYDKKVLTNNSVVQYGM